MASEQDLCVRIEVMRIGPNAIRKEQWVCRTSRWGWSATTELGGATAGNMGGSR